MIGSIPDASLVRDAITVMKPAGRTTASAAARADPARIEAETIGEIAGTTARVTETDGAARATNAAAGTGAAEAHVAAERTRAVAISGVAVRSVDRTAAVNPGRADTARGRTIIAVPDSTDRRFPRRSPQTNWTCPSGGICTPWIVPTPNSSHATW